MATTITYAVALATLKDFAVSAGFDNEEVIDKVDKLIAQKTRARVNTGKSKARKANEELAQCIVDTMLHDGVVSIDNRWVRENIDGVASPARATAVLNVAVEMDLLHRNIVAKSATRNVCTYTLK